MPRYGHGTAVGCRKHRQASLNPTETSPKPRSSLGSWRSFPAVGVLKDMHSLFDWEKMETWWFCMIENHWKLWDFMGISWEILLIKHQQYEMWGPGITPKGHWNGGTMIRWSNIRLLGAVYLILSQFETNPCDVILWKITCPLCKIRRSYSFAGHTRPKRCSKSQIPGQ